MKYLIGILILCFTIGCHSYKTPDLNQSLENLILKVKIKSDKTEHKVVFGPIFNENDIVLANKSKKIAEILLNTNLPPADYSKFYWMTNRNFYGLTIYKDLIPRAEQAVILIDIELLPYGKDFTTGQIVQFGSTILHELFHYHYLTKDPYTYDNVNAKINQKARELYDEKLFNFSYLNEAFFIKNHLELLVLTNGFDIKR